MKSGALKAYGSVLARLIAYFAVAVHVCLAEGATLPETPEPNQFVTVVGRVRAPGKVPWTSELTVRRALQRSGGIPFREPKWVYIIRGSERIPVRTRTLTGPMREPIPPQSDPPLQPNDTIEVPISEPAATTPRQRLSSTQRSTEQPRASQSVSMANLLARGCR